MSLVKTSTVSLNCEVDGPQDGPVLIFSNSLGANLTMWDAQAAHFSDRYRILRYDQRGHGGSEVVTSPYTFDDLGDDVIALMDALEIERAHFVGLSMGGMTALSLGIRHAHRMTSLTPCNCVASFSDEARATWDDRINVIEKGGLEAVLDATIERWFTAGFIEAAPDIVVSVREMVSATAVPGYLACCAALKQLDYAAGLSSIALPTLFIAGTHDVGTPAAAMREMHAQVSGAQYVELDAAHVSNIEQADRFNAALDAFLASVS